MGHQLPTHRDMVDAIVVAYDRATDDQVVAGKCWYGDARYIVERIADATGFGDEPMRVAYALAALSPRNPWAWNVADAYHFASAATHGGEMPTATTYGANRRAAWVALTSDKIPWSTTALKVRAFVSAIMGDELAVVVDVWAMRVVTNGAMSEAKSTKTYRNVAYAYCEAAHELGVTPSVAQAVTWLVAQAEGLGSGRRNRHDRSCKRGTPAFVRDLLT